MPITSCYRPVGLAPGSSCGRPVSLVPITSCGRLVSLVPITSCACCLFSTHPQTACRAHRFAGSSLRAATCHRTQHPYTITLDRTLLCRIRTPLPQRYTPPCHAHVPDPRSRPRVMGASLPPAEDVAARRRRLAATVTTARKTHGLNCTCTTTYSMEPGADGVVIIRFACGQWTTVNCRLNLSCLILIFSFSFTLYSTSCFLLRRTLLCLSLHSASVPIWPRPESAPTPYGPFAPRKSSTPYSSFASAALPRNMALSHSFYHPRLFLDLSSNCTAL